MFGRRKPAGESETVGRALLLHGGEDGRCSGFHWSPRLIVGSPDQQVGLAYLAGLSHDHDLGGAVDDVVVSLSQGADLFEPFLPGVILCVEVVLAELSNQPGIERGSRFCEGVSEALAIMHLGDLKC